MPLLTDPDGYEFAIQTPGEGDGNSFVLRPDGSVAWSKFEDQATRWTPPSNRPAPEPPPPLPAAPIPSSPPAPRPSGGLRRIQITKPEEGPFINRGQSYWSQGVIVGPDLYAFVGHQDEHPRFYKVHLPSGNVMPLGSLVSYRGTTEGWYWDALAGLWLVDGPRLRRLNLFTRPILDEVKLDIGATHPGCDLWQTHTSDDLGVHSATVRQVVSDGAYPALGTVVSRYGVKTFYAAYGYDLDESAVTPNATHVLIKSKPYDDNLVIDLATGAQQWLDMRDGALGHSDCGTSCAIGADRINGTCAVIDFRAPLAAGRPLYNTWNMGHISVRGQTAVISDATSISRIGLDGSNPAQLWVHEQHGDPGDVDYQVQANLTPDGSWACALVNGQLYALEMP